MKKLHYRLESDFSGKMKVIGKTEIGKMPPIVRENLISRWKHKEGSGTTLHDNIGSNNGTIVGDNYWNNTCPNGSPCGTYDGSTNYVYPFDTKKLFQLGESISLVAAVYFDNITNAHTIIDTSVTWQSRPNYRLLNNGGNEIRFTFVNPAINQRYYDTTDFNLLTDTWYIITVVFDYVNSSSIKIYKNTTLCNGSWNYPPSSVCYDPTNQRLTIGKCTNGGALYQGRLGDILLYDKNLNLSEITQNFDVLKERYEL